jgi:hypothetical protein
LPFDACRLQAEATCVTSSNGFMHKSGRCRSTVQGSCEEVKE